MRQLRTAVFVFLLVSLSFPALAQVDPALYSALRWRLAGPFRAGRSLTAVGVPGHPSLFYFGAVGGGVWMSTDAGRTWDPIFDREPIASIGAIAIAPSDPNVIYVGSGEADMRSDISYGNGMYKSTDGGKTWSHIGLEDSRQIGKILVDPHDPDLVYVAALGHAYAANSERGVFRTTDGGKTWSRVLYKNDDTGAIDLAFDPSHSKVIYASLWQTRRPPWNVYPPSNGPGSGLYKSTDGGATWHQLTNGLPTEGVGRIGIAVGPSQPNRVYLIVDAKDGGLYRSDDAGATFRRADNEARIWGRGWYFGSLTVDPKDPDVLYVANTSTYKSVDGGKSFFAFKGAPGGDDYHSIWVSPDDSSHIILSSDQGTVVTLNGGKTWSSWYNQPTGQFYHVITDNRFPYWIYGAQQDSGSMAVISRSNYASITAHDWEGVAAGGEAGMIAPDPLHPGILFGDAARRYDISTGQSQEISPTIGRPENFRQVWTLPIVVSPADPHQLYFSHQFLYRSVNGGKSWDQISPDLTRENPAVPPNLDPITAKYGLASPRKGVIYTIAPSPLDANLIWVGTDDGLIHRTTDDGAHWTDVTPRELIPWSKVGIIEASHFDPQAAYAAVDRHRLDDLSPYIYRTHDGGKTWERISTGIPQGAYVNVVREDPKRRGLLYAGTELGIFISFDDGSNWQPLQLNLPVTSVRDITIHDDDLVIATHGRAFWVLDDIIPLREITPQIGTEPVHLFAPQVALRIRKGTDQATPFPPETPHAENPPTGAIIDYYLHAVPSTPVQIDIVDHAGTVVRSYRSDENVGPIKEKSLTIPMYWVHPALPPSARAGMNRFIWDLHWPPLGPRGSYGSRPAGPLADTGEYTVRLIVDGKTYTKPLTLKMDPRIAISQADLDAQFAAAQAAATHMRELVPILTQAASIEKQLQQLQAKAARNRRISAGLNEFGRRFTMIAGPPERPYGAPVTPISTDRSSLRYLQDEFTDVESAVESADAAPTVDQQNALRQAEATLNQTLPAWRELVGPDLAHLNKDLRSAGLPPIDPSRRDADRPNPLE